MSIHIHRVPTRVTHEERGQPAWCFGCRKHLPGTYRVNTPIEPLSYYSPHWSYACDGCGDDRRLGFGWEWTNGTAGPPSGEAA